MKKHINKKQWFEISREQQLYFAKKCKIYIKRLFKANLEEKDKWLINHALDNFTRPDIGEMIEFLGPTYVKAVLYDVATGTNLKKSSYTIRDTNKLCDNLWELVKKNI